MEGAECQTSKLVKGEIHPLSELRVKKCRCPPISPKKRCQMVCLNNGHVIVADESELHEYDVSKDTWHALYEHELPATDFALVVYRSQLHLVGGKTAIPSSTVSMVITPSVKTGKIWHLDDKHGWVESPISPMPSSHSDAAAVADGDFLIVTRGPGITESDGIDIFDGKIWRPTVYVQQPEFIYPWVRQSFFRRCRIDLAVHDGHLYLFRQDLNIQAKQISSSFFGSISIKSLLEATTYKTYACWQSLEIPDRYQWVSNPLSSDGHFIFLVPYIYLNKQILSVNVYIDSSWHKVIDNVSMNCTIASPYITRLPTGNFMVIIDKEAFVMSIVVPPYCPNDMWITPFALITLNDLPEIQLLSQLQGKKLRQFKDQAGFNLQPTDETASDPVLRYIISWVIDAQQHELTRKPTWRNFIQVLEEIELGEVAKKIEEFCVRTCPGGPQQKKEISAVDEVAAVYQDLKSLSEELTKEQQPTTQASAIAQKIASCCDMCYSAFTHLGEERKAYERKIESLRKTQADQVEHKPKATPTLQLLLRELLSKVASKWENIGALLGVDDGHLSSIKVDNRGDSGDCLREMICIWLKKAVPLPSWNDIVEALECLGEEKFAQELSRKYCT